MKHGGHKLLNQTHECQEKLNKEILQLQCLVSSYKLLKKLITQLRNKGPKLEYQPPKFLPQLHQKFLPKIFL